MKEKFNKVTKAFMAMILLVTQLLLPVPAIALNASEVKDNNKVKGIVYNPQTVSVGDSATVTCKNFQDRAYGSEGDVEVQKIVSKTNVEGKYSVEFKVRGVPVTKGTHVINPVYVVIVLDASNSMDNPSIAKWNKAVQGAIDFENEMLKKVPDAKIALVKFAGKTTNKNFSDATIIRGFNYNKNDRLTASMIGGIGVNGGATNLGEGLRYAYNLLDSAPNNAKKYVIALSDGVPTLYTKENGDSTTTKESDYAKRYDTQAHNYANSWANKIKNVNDLNATLISVGYELDALEFSKDKKMAPQVLKGIATNNNFYIDADMDDVVSKIKNISSLVNTTYYPAVDLKIEDAIGEKFELVSGNNTLKLDKVTSKDNFQSVGKFYITLDKDTPNGWYETNDDFTWSYNDSYGVEKTFKCTDNPEVYWEAQKYNYTVNYYKDEITSPEDKEHFISSYTDSAPHGQLINTTDDNLLLKHIPENYDYTGVYDYTGEKPITSITIDKNGNNVINVLYTIKKHKYTVNYYYANTFNEYALIPDSTQEFSNIKHGSEIKTTDYYLKDDQIKKGFELDQTTTNEKNENEYIIKDNETVINIYYKRKGYQYTVNYHFNGIKDDNLGKLYTGVYGSEKYAKDNYLEDVDKEGYENKNVCDNTEYFLQPKNPNNESSITISDNFLNNVLNIYYVDTKIVKENIKKESETEIIKDPLQSVSYTVEYSSEITNVQKGSEIVVTIKDYLPFEIDEEKSKLYDENVVGKYDKESKTITWIYKENAQDYIENYQINKKINYTVVYKNFEHISSEKDNYIVNNVIGKTSVGKISTRGVSDSEQIAVEINGKLIVNYVTVDGKKIVDSIESNGLVGSSYKTEEKTFDNYSFVKVIGQKEGKLINGTTEVTYVYEFLPLPPQTGDNDSFSLKYLLMLLLLPLLKKVLK